MIVTKWLPESCRAALRPMYHKIFHGKSMEQPTNLAIGTYSGLELAYRDGTTDQVIIGNLDHYRLQNLIPNYNCRPDSIIINIGAHIGIFALLAAAAVPQGAVYAVEASKDTFNLLRINSALNNVTNLKSHHLAISDKSGTTKLYHDVGHWGHSIANQLSTEFELVRCVTLAEFLADNEIEQCDLLYLNCEGAEFQIILGASFDTLKKFNMILADVHPIPKYQASSLVSHLSASGLQVSLLHSDGGYDRVLAVRP